MSKKFIIPEDVQGLIQATHTQPVVLLVKLICDALSTRHDQAALALHIERAALVHDIRALVATHELVAPHLKLGATARVYTNNVEIPGGGGGAYYNSELAGVFKAMSTSQSKSVDDGLARALPLKAFPTNAAYYYVADRLEQSRGSGDRDTAYCNLLMRLGIDVSRSDLRLGRGDNNFQVEGKHGVDGGVRSVTVYLEDIAPLQHQQLKALSQRENALHQKMLDDANLPALLDHPELRTLLGFDINPQAVRAKVVTAVFTGAGLR